MIFVVFLDGLTGLARGHWGHALYQLRGHVVDKLFYQGGNVFCSLGNWFLYPIGALVGASCGLKWGGTQVASNVSRYHL